MYYKIYETVQKMGQAAAEEGAFAISKAIEEEGKAGIILATGASQFKVIEALIKRDDIDWSKVTVFHLDEYIGLPQAHPASFRKYLKERFVDHIPNLNDFVYIHGDNPDLQSEVFSVSQKILECAIDVAFVGIGENAHLAFNDPPADFTTEEPYIIVNLDEKCKNQQVQEGWFKTLEDVPAKAISMSIQQILKSKKIIVSVPDERKAMAVRQTIKGDVSPLYPASILQTHSNVSFYLDKLSSAQLSST